MMESERLARDVVEKLKQVGRTVSTAESCSGGLLGKLLTDFPGSSQVYLGGVISYTNQVKETILGVERELLDTLGPVSEPVARAMAKGVCMRLHSDYGLSITGLAGPEGDGSGKPLGLVYVALNSPKETVCQELHLSGSRTEIRQSACQSALRLLLNVLNNLQ